MPLLPVSLICSWTGPWVWVQEEVKKCLEIYNIIPRGKDFTALYIHRICQTCWGWSKSFAWISGQSCKDRLFLGTFTDLRSRIHCYTDYTKNKITSPWLVSPSRRNSNVSVRYPATTRLSSSQISAQVSTLARGLPQCPSSAHELLKWEKLQISSPSAFRDFPSNFLLPFSFLCTALQMEASGLKRIISK